MEKFWIISQYLSITLPNNFLAQTLKPLNWNLKKNEKEIWEWNFACAKKDSNYRRRIKLYHDNWISSKINNCRIISFREVLCFIYLDCQNALILITQLCEKVSERSVKEWEQVDVKTITLIIIISMTYERNIARVQELFGHSVRSLVMVHSGNPIWRTSKAVERSDLLEKQAETCPSSSSIAGSCLIEARAIFNSSWRTVRGSRSNEKYIFPRSRLSSFHSDYLQRRAPSRRKVEKEIRLHVSRINFSLALDVLLFQNPLSFRTDVSAFCILDIFFLRVTRKSSVSFSHNVVFFVIEMMFQKKIEKNTLKSNI